MRASVGTIGWGATLAVLMSMAPRAVLAQDAPAPGPRSIPGITAEDPFPEACVSCHVVLPDGMDVRLSTLMKGWVVGVDSVLLATAQSTAPAGLILSGKHPDVPEPSAGTPAGCLMCHGTDAMQAPPFSRLMHRIHLTGDETSIYMSMFQGECTYCHKLDMSTGAWTIPSGREP